MQQSVNLLDEVQHLLYQNVLPFPEGYGVRKSERSSCGDSRERTTCETVVRAARPNAMVGPLAWAGLHRLKLDLRKRSRVSMRAVRKWCAPSWRIPTTPFFSPREN